MHAYLVVYADSQVDNVVLPEAVSQDAVHFLHAGNSAHKGGDFVVQGLAGHGVHQGGSRFAHDGNAGAQNKERDQPASGRVHPKVTQPAHKDAQRGSRSRQDIVAVVRRQRFHGLVIGAFADAGGNHEKRDFDEDSAQRDIKSEQTAPGEITFSLQQMDKRVDSVPKEGQRGGNHKSANHQRANAFVLGVSERVFVVRWLVGGAHENRHYQVVNHIRSGVDAVRQKRRGTAENAHDGLDQGQDDIRAKAKPNRKVGLFNALTVIHADAFVKLA